MKSNTTEFSTLSTIPDYFTNENISKEEIDKSLFTGARHDGENETNITENGGYLVPLFGQE